MREIRLKTLSALAELVTSSRLRYAMRSRKSSAHTSTLDEFRKFAPGNGVDADLVIKALVVFLT